MDRYEGANDVDALVLYVNEMKSMTLDTTHIDVCQLFLCTRVMSSLFFEHLVLLFLLLLPPRR